MSDSATDALKDLVRRSDPSFWSALAEATTRATALDELLFLSRLRRSGKTRVPRPATRPLKLAILGAYALHPLSEVLEHILEASGFAMEMFVGDYDNYNAEVREENSPVRAFAPEVTLLLPNETRCVYEGSLTDSEGTQREAALGHVRGLIELCTRLRDRVCGDIILANYTLPPAFDPGPYRVRSLGSEWTFKKLVNLELGLRAPPYVQICDIEFLACRRGLVRARDERAWFESKQPGSPDLILDIAREVAHIVRALKGASAKVLALDLDNTLWGGVVGDDGLEGIEIGDTSPRGEAFKAFQRQILTLARRGVLLAVCSKNDERTAREAFEKHPEMVLKIHDFAAFIANWEPKSENLRAIARELNVGVDSIVFVDDSAAEIDIVRRFVPDVRTILLGPDPSTYARTLADSRYFEPLTVTAEDLARGELYRTEQRRRADLATVTDMDAYLASLEMKARIKAFAPIDVPRIAQLINKTNQFNVTTIRRSESQVLAMIGNSTYPSFVIRLSDRFGDHGLISIVIGELGGSSSRRDLIIDTWLMSCRVLKRQVEEEALGEIARLARTNGCTRILGRYVRTAKNDLVHDLYPRLGFAPLAEDAGTATYSLEVASFVPPRTKIQVTLEDA